MGRLDITKNSDMTDVSRFYGEILPTKRIGFKLNLYGETKLLERSEKVNYTKAMSTLEFDKILSMLAECAATDGARESALGLVPENDAFLIRKRLSQTSCAKSMIAEKGTPSFGRVVDICAAADRAEKGSVLSTRELLDSAEIFHTARSLTDYYKAGSHAEEEKINALKEHFDMLYVDKKYEDRINKIIIAEDMIADDASPALSDIRRKIKNTGVKVKETLSSYVSGAFSKYLQDNIVTIRNGRYVIPVKAEYKNEVKGLVHDTSSSGATYFIEPLSVVNANNELKALLSSETHEIERILSELSAECAERADILMLNYHKITELAFIFAKGELSYKMNACEPILNDERRVLKLIRARHPLIDREKVVPISVSLGESYDTIIITGPNTGGKTVALKTMGLFALMAQAGLHIPCDDGSEICVFDSVLADIGDEQSIEQSLSTFSSHMVNIVEILKYTSDRSLVLFDELGAGTDPTEGASLAIAVIERVRELGALCAATTHYAEMKAYALETDGVTNASCEFDVETLKPTYRLIVGTPGKSNAFAISLKLGIPKEIIDRAKAHIKADDKQFEKVIEQLEKSRIEMEREREAAAKSRIEYEAYRESEEAKLKQRLERAEKELQDASEKASQIITSARATSDFVLEQLENVKKKQQSKKFSDELDKARADIRRELRAGRDAANPVNERKNEGYVLPRPLKRGDQVTVISIGKTGVLLDNPDKEGNVSVQSGLIKTRTNIKNLMIEEEAATVTTADRKSHAASVYKTIVSKTFSPSLDLRGETGDDAWFAVDKYLDEAKIANSSSVTLIHGKGTGALRNALWKKLKTDSRVKSFRSGLYGEGDTGVTVVELK